MGRGYVMKVSSNGRVSIPAQARKRWNADRMLVVDFGDRVVMRPFPDDPVGDLMGKYAGLMPSTDELRREEREADAEREEERERQLTGIGR